ncbi:MAG: Gfo/Idh/MocA family oxidoreductase [Pirellulales bacterium]
MLLDSVVDYTSQRLSRPDVGIGVIGCGGIIEHHLQAYVDAGLKVVALCDLQLGRAEKCRSKYFPNASVTDNYQELLRDHRVEVVDVATHPDQRMPILRDAILARKHVLSQKPFVLDVDEGYRLVDLAEQKKIQLSVNQNGRFAPHFLLARKLIAHGALGETFASHLSVHWDHRWIESTVFNEVKHLILYDFAIHWFDIVRCLMLGQQPRFVFASTHRAHGQTAKPNMLGQAMIDWDAGQSSLVFDGNVPFGPHDRTYVAGTKGSLLSEGIDYHHQSIRVAIGETTTQPTLQGRWFSDAFRGTMVEFLLSLEQNRVSELNARDNLRSLELCFAAVASAQDGERKVPGQIRRLPD